MDPARAAQAATTHLIKLSSLESDGRDEELRVVWELEQATDVHDQYELPSPQHGFDEPGRLDAFLDAVRWGAIASADKTALQAPFRSGVEIQEYQLDPVVRALSMPRTNLLIADAEITRRSGRAVLKVERDLARDLERLVDALAGSRQELHLNAATVERVVRTGLLLGQGKDLTEVPDPRPRLGARCFRLPELTGAWARARNDGLRHPLTHRERLVVFDETEARDRTDVVHMHLGHRLVQMCLRLLRAELWEADASGKLSRVTARVVPDGLLRQPAVVAHGRVVITGSGGARLHEEVIAAGGLIEGGRLAVAKKDEVEAWLAAATEELPAEDVRTELAGLWPQLEERLGRALNTQANRRFRSLETLLAKRCEEEVDGIRAVLEDLRQSIRDRLDGNEYWEQESLFKIDDERNQLHADREALKERWKRLPQVIETETAALRRRWADPSPRWFPVSVTFLVPRSLSPLAATARQESR